MFKKKKQSKKMNSIQKDNKIVKEIMRLKKN